MRHKWQRGTFSLRVQASFGQQPDPAYGKPQPIQWQPALFTASDDHSKVDAPASFRDRLIACGAACVAKRTEIEKSKA